MKYDAAIKALQNRINELKTAELMGDISEKTNKLLSAGYKLSITYLQEILTEEEVKNKCKNIM